MEQQPTAAQQPRRIKIGVYYAQEQRITEDLRQICAFVNGNILPAMAALSLPVSMGAILRYAANPQEMHVDYIANEVKAAAPSGATQMLREIFEERAASQAEEIAPLPMGAKHTKHAELLWLNEAGQLTYKAEAVTEAATRYITNPEEIAAYDRHQAAVKAMNDFFRGKAPDAWTGLRNYFWLDNAGKVVAAENVDYSAYK